MKKIHWILALACMIFTTSLWAQNGQIQGNVREAVSGMEVIGASVFVEGTTNGVVTDFEGNFILKNIEAGTHKITCGYIGFTKLTLEVEVKANETAELSFKLKEEETMTGEVIVEAKMSRNTEASVLTIKSKSASVVDGISSAQISKSGDSDAAAAVRRITGITVEGGKYIYVRGLGDRYSKTTLNGAEIPGLDPNRNTIQMDLFPSNLLDNILVYKSFTPELYGDFTGGYVDLATKDFPEVFTFSASLSSSYNTVNTFNPNFLSYEGGKHDWLGFDDGSRQLPDQIRDLQSFPNYRPSSSGNFDPTEAQALEDATHSFANNWNFQEKAPPVNHSLSLSLGNQTKLFNRPLGMIGAFTYQHNYSGYRDGAYGIYELTSTIAQSNRLTSQMRLNDNKGSEDVLWGAMFGSTYKLSRDHKIGVTLLRNQSATSTARFSTGTKGSDDPDDIFQTRSLRFLQRSLTTGQLRGEHLFRNLNEFEIKWQSSYSVSTQDEPDLRYFTNRIEFGGTADIKTSDNPPSRFFREMQQGNFSNRVDFTLPFKQWSGATSKFKFGATHVNKDRAFRENRYVMTQVGSVPFDGNPEAYFAAENLIDFDPSEGSYANGGNGIVAEIGVDSANNYNAFQTVLGSYLMVDLPVLPKLRFVGGARLETTQIALFSFDATLRETMGLDGEQNLLNNIDILPAISLTYDLTTKMKLKGSYSRTLARPTFRELAPYTSFDVDGGYLLAGNPNLERSLADNADLRWEFYPTYAELISVGVFYKNFINPIERTFNPTAPNAEITFRNVPNATLMGTEFELKKNLGFIHAYAKSFSFAANFSYIYSRTQIDPLEYQEILATDTDAKPYREMFGQSPFSANASLAYKNEKGTSANLVFNIVGPRIAVIVRGGTPDVYERARPLLGFNISQEFANNFKVKLAANNLLNTTYRESIQYKGGEYYVRQNPIGMSFSVGISYNFKGKEAELE